MTANGAPERSKIRVPKGAEVVTGHIRRLIASGELSQGDALPAEAELQEDFGVSRPVLREAFRILEAERLIVIKRGIGGGPRVRLPNHDVVTRYTGLILQYDGVTLADAFEARTLVELPAARILASRPDRAEVAHKLREVFDANRNGDHRGHSTAVHRLLVELTGNEVLILFSSVLQDITAAASRVIDQRPAADLRQHTRSDRAHARLIELIGEGRPDEAEVVWRRHLVEGEQYLQAAGGSAVLDLFC